MKYYRLEPSVKKSVIEWHSFKRKDADGNTIFLRKELGWRRNQIRRLPAS